MATNEELQKQLAEMQAQIQKLSGNKPVDPPDTSEKTYYHRVPGSTVVVMKENEEGTKMAVIFEFDHEGKMTTSDPDVNAFMKSVMKSPGSPITLHAPLSKKDPLQLQAEKEVIAIAERSIDKLGAEAGKAKG